jgi:CRP-like cAMP-binding protein
MKLLARGRHLLHRLLGTKGETMQSLNWQDFLKGHVLFSSLSEAEIAQLLRGEAAQERSYPQGGVILREGEFGDSLFLIGSGSVQVSLPGPEARPVPVSILKADEFFGEMAVVEHRPRSATVTAAEPCLLLEIQGEAFRKLLETHPDMRAQVYAKMNARSGQASRQ